MKYGQGRAQDGGPGTDRGGDIRRNTDAGNDTTLPRSFQQLVAQHERFSTWRYTLSGAAGTLYLISSEKLNRDEALKALSDRYGDRLLTLKAGGAHE